MKVSGHFNVELLPQADEECAAGRMLIKKTYTGGLAATGTGQMISKRTETGVAAYYAVEEVKGTLAGKSGAFTLLHEGYMDSARQELKVTILAASGADELETISGSMSITQDDDGHQYEIDYTL